MGKRVDSILGDYTSFTKDADMVPHRAIKTTVSEVDCWITEDYMGSDRAGLFSRNGVDEALLEPYYYLRRSPILCGLMIFRFSLTMNELGLKTSNQWGSTSKLRYKSMGSGHKCPKWRIGSFEPNKPLHCIQQSLTHFTQLLQLIFTTR